MKHYYINDNAQNTGEHEVHTESCPYFNLITDRTYLGFFHSCKDAVEKANIQMSTGVSIVARFAILDREIYNRD